MSRRFLDILLGSGLAFLAVAAANGLRAPAEVRAADAAPAAPEFVMATGTQPHGGALLFLLDSKTRVLTCYEAEGGPKATRGLTFVGARKVEWDMYATGYNDKSEYSYQDMVKRFEAEAAKAQGDAPADGAASKDK